MRKNKEAKKNTMAAVHSSSIFYADWRCVWCADDSIRR